MRRSGLTRELLWALAALALLASACSGARATASTDDLVSSSEECFLGLDLWDTDPALTWIADGRVWVRAGDHQACLSTTTASDIWWSADGRRLLLDDQLVLGGSSAASPDLVNANHVVWQQPLGETLFTVDDGGQVDQHDLAAVTPAKTSITKDAVVIASHPDAAHLATVDAAGIVRLVSLDTGDGSTVLALDQAEVPIQMEFSADGSRLWILTEAAGVGTARYIDLVPVSDFLDLPEVESMVPSSVPEQPTPDLYFLATDLNRETLDLETGVGATGNHATGIVLHPSHPGWVVLSEGSCSDALSSLFVDGELRGEGIPGEAVGFFRGRGIPILATFTGGGECGSGQLWVTSGLPLQNSPVLVADDVSAADIRDEAPDPWNPNTAPPFA